MGKQKKKQTTKGRGRKKVYPVEQQLRQILKDSELSLYRIAMNAGVPYPSVTRFVKRERGLAWESFCRVAEALQVRLIAANPDNSAQQKKTG